MNVVSIMQVPRLKEIEVKLEIINKPGSYIQLAMKYRYQEHSFHSDLYYFRFKIYCIIWPRLCIQVNYNWNSSMYRLKFVLAQPTILVANWYRKQPKVFPKIHFQQPLPFTFTWSSSTFHPHGVAVECRGCRCNKKAVVSWHLTMMSNKSLGNCNNQFLLQVFK